MLTIISPAKNLDFETETYNVSTQPKFIEQSKTLIQTLQRLKSSDLEKLMKISPKIADLNFERNQEWVYPFPEGKSKAAGLAFNGEVYTGLSFNEFSEDESKYAQDHLRILSGLYGLLKPYDEILPYRLEMGTRLGTENSKNLYEFWGTQLLEEINEVIKSTNSNFLVNLASTEYSKAAKLKNIEVPVITPHFKDNKNSTFKVIMMYAKKARGQMAAFILKNKITTLEQIKSYNEGGYTFNEELSKDLDLVFTRG